MARVLIRWLLPGLVCGAVAFMVAVSAASAAAEDAGSFELITAAEAASPELSPSDWHIDAGLGDGGPVVDLIAPEQGKRYRPPVEILVRFSPTVGTEIDPATFRMEYLKFITIDLTSRVRRYVTKEGIQVPSASIPSGTHTIRLTIGDNEGNMTSRVFTVEVF